jgi:hypothetical protein
MDPRMKMPLVFLGPNGSWDLELFESVGQAKGWAEPEDVVAGEYGDHGWDADGQPVVLVAIPLRRVPGFIGWLRSLHPSLEVDVRALQAPSEPEMLRKALIGRFEELEPDLVVAADKMALDDLIALVRGLVGERLRQVEAGRYPSRGR